MSSITTVKEAVGVFIYYAREKNRAEYRHSWRTGAKSGHPWTGMNWIPSIQTIRELERAYKILQYQPNRVAKLPKYVIKFFREYAGRRLNV